MKPTRTLRLAAERLPELTADDLRGVNGAMSGWDPCGWPVNTIETCHSVCVPTCVVC